METPHICLSDLLLLDVPPRSWERNSSASSVLPACRTPHLHFSDVISLCLVLSVGCARDFTLFIGHRELFHTVKGLLLTCCDKQGWVTQQPCF